MACDNELWAIALRLEQDHGREAARHIAERIGGAAIAGEWDDVRMWKAVAAKYDQLLHQGAGMAS
jgi:hypothetical protein